jgi:hypothetical protein
LSRSGVKGYSTLSLNRSQIVAVPTSPSAVWDFLYQSYFTATPNCRNLLVESGDCLIKNRLATTPSLDFGNALAEQMLTLDIGPI